MDATVCVYDSAGASSQDQADSIYMGNEFKVPQSKVPQSTSKRAKMWHIIFLIHF